MRPFRRLPLLLAAVGAVATVSAVAAAPLSAQLRPPRSAAAPGGWAVAWDSATDSTLAMLAEVRQVVVSGPVAVTLDEGAREVVGVDIATGRPRFRRQARGEGPGEFRRPALIVPTPTGVAVWDMATARLTAFTRQGTLAWDAPLPVGSDLLGLCVTPGPRIHAVLKRRDSSVVTFDTTGRRLAVRTVGWTSLPPNLPTFAYQGAIAGDGVTPRCALAPLFGREWATIPDQGPIARHPLVTAGPPPAVKTTVVSRTRTGPRSFRIRERQESTAPVVSGGITMLGDTVAIVAAEATGYARRVLDLYHLPTGRYVGSRVVPFVATGVALAPQGRHLMTYILDERVGVALLQHTPPPRAGGARQGASPAPNASSPSRR